MLNQSGKWKHCPTALPFETREDMISSPRLLQAASFAYNTSEAVDNYSLVCARVCVCGACLCLFLLRVNDGVRSTSLLSGRVSLSQHTAVNPPPRPSTPPPTIGSLQLMVPGMRTFSPRPWQSLDALYGPVTLQQRVLYSAGPGS